MNLNELMGLGMPSRSDVLIASMQAKAEPGKNQTSIEPGDLVVLNEDSTVSKASAAQCVIYGVATLGIHGFTVPVVTSGHVIAAIDTAIFAGLKVGEYVSKDAKNCGPMVVRKMKAKKSGVSDGVDAYELRI